MNDDDIRIPIDSEFIELADLPSADLCDFVIPRNDLSAGVMRRRMALEILLARARCDRPRRPSGGMAYTGETPNKRKKRKK